jgi:hypothetical protein
MHVVRVKPADDRGESYQWDGSAFSEAWDFDAEAHFSALKSARLGRR